MSGKYGRGPKFDSSAASELLFEEFDELEVEEAPRPNVELAAIVAVVGRIVRLRQQDLSNTQSWDPKRLLLRRCLLPRQPPFQQCKA